MVQYIGVLFDILCMSKSILNPNQGESITYAMGSYDDNMIYFRSLMSCCPNLNQL